LSFSSPNSFSTPLVSQFLTGPAKLPAGTLRENGFRALIALVRSVVFAIAIQLLRYFLIVKMDDCVQRSTNIAGECDSLETVLRKFRDSGLAQCARLPTFAFRQM